MWVCPAVVRHAKFSDLLQVKTKMILIGPSVAPLRFGQGQHQMSRPRTRKCQNRFSAVLRLSFKIKYRLTGLAQRQQVGLDQRSYSTIDPVMPGWATIFGRVNHLDAEPGTQAYSAWARTQRVGWNEYTAKAGQ